MVCRGRILDRLRVHSLGWAHSSTFLVSFLCKAHHCRLIHCQCRLVFPSSKGASRYRLIFPSFCATTFEAAAIVRSRSQGEASHSRVAIPAIRRTTSFGCVIVPSAVRHESGRSLRSAFHSVSVCRKVINASWFWSGRSPCRCASLRNQDR